MCCTLRLVPRFHIFLYIRTYYIHIIRLICDKYKQYNEISVTGFGDLRYYASNKDNTNLEICTE